MFNSNDLDKLSVGIAGLSTDVADLATSYSSFMNQQEEQRVNNLSALNTAAYNIYTRFKLADSNISDPRLSVDVVPSESQYNGLLSFIKEYSGYNAGSATSNDVLKGKTFLAGTGTMQSGGMPNNGAVSGSIAVSGGTYTIPEGYHNGQGKVTGPTLASLIGTNVTLASNSNLVKGNTAYGKNGTKYTGTLENVTGSLAYKNITESGTNVRITVNKTAKVTEGSTYIDVPVGTIKSEISAFSGNGGVFNINNIATAVSGTDFTAVSLGGQSMFRANVPLLTIMHGLGGDYGTIYHYDSAGTLIQKFKSSLKMRVIPAGDCFRFTTHGNAAGLVYKEVT